ncbi:hypothetical protein A4A49_65453, partial [Nicotiana attenuata]
LCLWEIWFTRNNNCFYGKREPISCKNAITRAVECIHVDGGYSDIPTNVLHIKRHPSRRGHYKLNTEATLQKGFIGELGGVIRNNNGGLRMEVSNNFMPLEVNIDSIDVIHSINKGNLIYETIVCECRSLLTALGHPQVNHNYREVNRVADKLAKEAGKITKITTNFLVVHEAIWANILGSIFEKK